MNKSVFQSGMSWKVINSKWPEIQEAFQGFDIHAVTNLHDKDLEEPDIRVAIDFAHGIGVGLPLSVTVGSGHNRGGES